MTNLERMTQTLITEQVVSLISSIFGVSTPSESQIAAVRMLVMALWPEFEAEINRQNFIFSQLQAEMGNLVRLYEYFQQTAPDDPCFLALGTSITTLNSARPNIINLPEELSNE